MKPEEYKNIMKSFEKKVDYDACIEPVAQLMNSCLKYGFTREEAMLIIITSIENK